MKALFKPTSYHRGAQWAIAATLTWKLISFANALLIAAFFGATFRTDIYFYLIMLMGFGFTFLQRLNNTVLIPEAMFLQAENPQQSQQFLTMWLYIYAGIGVILCTIGFLFPVRLWLLFSGFDVTYLTAQRNLLCAGFVLFSLYLLTYYLQAVVEMFKFFGTAWLGILNALCPFIFLLCFGRKIGLISMVYGFLVSNLLQIIILLVLLRTQLHWTFTPAWIRLEKRAQQNAAAGQLLAALEIANSWLPIYLISAIGTGFISALNYCRQLTDSPTEILTNRLINVSKIALTEQAAHDHKEAFDRAFLQTNFILIFLLTPLTVFTIYFAPDIVDLFFKRGKFTTLAAQHTVQFLRPFIVTVLLLAPSMVQSAAIAAQRKVKENFPYALCASTIFFIAILCLIPRYGAFMYAYLSIGGLVLGGYLNYLFFRKHLPFVSFKEMYLDLAKLTILNFGALLCATIVKGILPSLGTLLSILICGIFYMTGLFLLTSQTGLLKRFLQSVRG